MTVDLMVTHSYEVTFAMVVYWSAESFRQRTPHTVNMPIIPSLKKMGIVTFNSLISKHRYKSRVRLPWEKGWRSTNSIQGIYFCSGCHYKICSKTNKCVL